MPVTRSSRDKMAESPLPEPSTATRPSLRRSLRLTSSSPNPISSPPSVRCRNAKRKIDSAILIVEGENRVVDDDQSVSKRKQSIETRSSKGIVINETILHDENWLQGGNEISKVSERKETEEGRYMNLRSSSSVAKGKILDGSNDLDKIDGNVEIIDDLGVKQRLEQTQDTKLSNIVDEISERVIIEEREVHIDEALDEYNPHSNRKISTDKKGKGKMIAEEDSDSDSDPDSLSDSEFDEGINYFPHTEVPVPLIPTNYKKSTEKTSASRREADRKKAIELAPKFAFFRTKDQSDEIGSDEDPPPNSDEIDDWPGPFSTAMKIIKDREAKLQAREKNHLQPNRPADVSIPWVPSREKNCSLRKTPPSLKTLCMKVLMDNSDEIESLEGIPDATKNEIVKKLCDSRKMNSRYLSQITRHIPLEICVSDCSWLTEQEFEQIFADCNTSNLQVLKLDLCGRCMPDHILNKTLTKSPNNLQSLKKLSLKGGYSLSDEGLASITSSSPLLESIDLSRCSFVSTNGIVDLLDKLRFTLRELRLDECQNVDAMILLPFLKNAEFLEVLSLAGISSVSDKFVRELFVDRGSRFKKLSFAGCVKVSSVAMKVIGENCGDLLELDIRNLNRLNDSALAYLANGCGNIQKLRLRRNSFSDEAVAAFVEASGANLIELSLNNVNKVGHHTALAIYKRCRALKSLDLSFCREMSDEALGLIVDTCLSLKILKLFGCTQIKGRFLDGHSNSSVKILGLGGNILDEYDFLEFI